ncbi:glutaredoxin-1 [Anser cygnoides]|uniref:glutaredoxin-1 n=1 Tax=Anser cygnoides TaxID=8845 RepID=UPI002009AE7C|nr:glutaredoxin-1 [Anser cygnoides]
MVDAFVKSKIRDDKVTLFIKASCPYCRNAVELLQEFNFLPGHLEVVDITGMEDVQDYFQRTTGQRTVPRVFIGRTCIGGFSDLQNLYQELPGMLQKIGALQ